MLNPRVFSFGGTSAIITSMGLIVGLGAATARTTTIVSGLLIFGLADNMTDALSIHMYQEAERLEGPRALRATLTNFVTRLLVTLTFVIVVLTLPDPYAGVIALAWGFLLLVGLTYVLAQARSVSPVCEIGKHLGVAVLVIAASRVIGLWIVHYVH